MNKLVLVTQVLCLSLATGCPGEPSTNDPEAITAGATDTGDAPPGSSSGTGDQPTDADTGAAASSTTDGIAEGECDPWAQDCPDGYKCMAFAPEGEDFFTGDKCTPVVEDPVGLGDPCKVVDGWWSGIDDCDYGLACWDINHDDNTGICRALCTGDADAAECPQAEGVCAFWVPGIAHVCLETCDPLVQDCDPGLGCGPEWSSNAGEWVCLAEYSGTEGQQFDPCFASNTCDPGLLCWDPTKAIECAGAEAGCCLSLCDLTAPQCTGQGAVCTPFYDIIEGSAPPEYANVGMCVLPG